MRLANPDGVLKGGEVAEARIVVDTSLHMKEMTFDQAVDFMVKNGNLTPPNAKAEVGRYCSWPTQASSYLTGMLEIVDIRTRWLAGCTMYCAAVTIERSGSG